MSNRDGYTNNTVIVSDLLAAGSINVFFRSRLTEPQLTELKKVAGVTGVIMINGAYGTSGATDRPHYGANIGCARAFSFDELAPQIALVVIDALGIKLDDLDLRVESGGTRAERDNSTVVTAMRKLRQPTPRNPFYEGAATMNDVVVGAELLTVGHAWHVEATPYKLTQPPTKSGQHDYCLYPGRMMQHFLSDMGVVPYGRGNWNESYLTIVNNTTNRRKLVQWLVQRDHAAQLSATKIMELYPDDFTAKVVVEDGKLVGKIS